MKRGFTLIELLIVVVIVGILMAVAVPKYRVALERGRSQEGVVYIKALADDLNSYYWMWGHYPTIDSDLGYYDGNTYWNNLEERSLPKLKHFTQQTPGRGCSAKNCIIAVDRETKDYSILAFLDGGDTQKIMCNYCVQTGPNEVTCDPNRESYKRYCSVIGKETRYTTSGGTYGIDYMILGEP